jgi:hypothetical protein
MLTYPREFLIKIQENFKTSYSAKPDTQHVVFVHFCPDSILFTATLSSGTGKKL